MLWPLVSPREPCFQSNCRVVHATRHLAVLSFVVLVGVFSGGRLRLAFLEVYLVQFEQLCKWRMLRELSSLFDNILLRFALQTLSPVQLASSVRIVESSAQYGELSSWVCFLARVFALLFLKFTWSNLSSFASGACCENLAVYSTTFCCDLLCRLCPRYSWLPQ